MLIDEVYEMCPYCDTEVVLKNVQEKTLTECTNCGEEILPCSLCDMDIVNCSLCMEGGYK